MEVVNPATSHWVIETSVPRFSARWHDEVMERSQLLSLNSSLLEICNAAKKTLRSWRCALIGNMWSMTLTKGKDD